MTLTLTPEKEARLLTIATGRGLPPEMALETLLDQAFRDAETELMETTAGLKASIADFDAGRWITPEELDAQLRARKK